MLFVNIGAEKNERKKSVAAATATDSRKNPAGEGVASRAYRIDPYTPPMPRAYKIAPRVVYT